MSYRYVKRPGPDPELWITIASIAAVAFGLAVIIGALWLLEYL